MSGTEGAGAPAGNGGVRGLVDCFACCAVAEIMAVKRPAVTLLK